MQYIALLLLVANIALFGYQYMFAAPAARSAAGTMSAPQARSAAGAMSAPQAQSSATGAAAPAEAADADGHSMRLVTEVAPGDLKPRSGS